MAKGWDERGYYDTWWALAFTAALVVVEDYPDVVLVQIEMPLLAGRAGMEWLGLFVLPCLA